MSRIFFAFLLILSFCGCTTQQSQLSPLASPENPYPPDRPPVVGDILHIPTGIYVDQATLYAHAQRARIVYVGETHDNPASHRIQLNVLRKMVAVNPNQVTVGMEMFTPQQQSLLDQWSAGVLSEKAFLKAVDWAGTWGMNFAYYRELLTFCQEHKIKILGLNTDRATRMAVARQPIDALEPTLRDKLPEMDESDPYHQAMLESVFRDHKMTDGMLEGFKRVQTLWDETMAENAARYLERVSKDHQLLILAGSKHISYGYGIPRRLFSRVPDSYLLIGNRELVINADKKDKLMNIEKPNYPMPPYHFMVYTEYENLENPGVKLGVMLEPHEDGLQIINVLPDAAAAKAGLKAGDILTRLDDKKLEEVFDLTYELNQHQIGDKVELTVQRADQLTVVPVEFAGGLSD